MWVSCIIKVEWIDDPTQSMLINDFAMLYISLQCAEKMAFVAKNKSLKKGSKYSLNPSGQSSKSSFCKILVFPGLSKWLKT